MKAFYSNIVYKLQKGDTDAFKHIYQLYGGKIYYLAKSFGLNHEDSEEIVQETFYKILSNKDKLKPVLSLQAYILKTAKNILLNNLRRNATITMYKEYLNREQLENTTEDQVLFNDLERNFNKFLDALPKQRKMVFILSKFHDLSNADIARQLNLSKRTVENQLYRAIQTLKKNLKDLEVTFPVLLICTFLLPV